MGRWDPLLQEVPATVEGVGYGSGSNGGGGGTYGGSSQNCTSSPGDVVSGFNVTSVPVKAFTVRYKQI